MADPLPAQSPAPNVIAPEKAMTRFEAQRKLGLFAPHDYVMLSLIVLIWVTLGFWKLFGTPTALQLVALGLVNIVLTQFWMIVLVYRCMVFTLDLHADVALMPEAAARIVVGYWEGRRATPTPK